MLRWYPRAWRERYGKEFLAMVEDSLDGRRPTWRLRVSVAWAGLRERGHQARLTSQKALLRGLTRGWLTFQVAGYLIAVLPSEFKASPPPARQCAGRVLLRRRREPVPATRMNLAGIPQLSLLLFIFAISFFLLPFAVETLLRRHGSP